MSPMKTNEIDAAASSPVSMQDNAEGMESLKPCPFCGGEVELVRGDENAYVQCLHVKFHRALWLDGDNAVADVVTEAWNTRVSSPVPSIDVGGDGNRLPHADIDALCLMARKVPIDTGDGGGAPFTDFLDYQATDAEELGITLPKDDDGRPRFSINSYIRSEEIEETEIAILRPVVRPILAALTASPAGDDPKARPAAALLTADEKRSQAERCACHGSDDYCPCQNAPDRQTIKARAALAPFLPGKEEGRG